MFTHLRKQVVVILVIAVLALAITPFAGAQEGPKPEAVGLRPDAPPYALHGPYWVGARDFVIDPESDRPLAITVWYPALNPDGKTEETIYDMAAGSSIRFAFPANTDWSIRGRAIMDALPDMSTAPYPLVVYSHGVGAWRQMSSYFVEHLASHGFVVVAADHPGEAPVAEMFWQAFIHRPDDIRRVIDYASSLTAPGSAMENLIDLAQVGVTGASMGGYTALAAAGARIDWTGLMSWCADHPQDDPLGICPVLAQHGAEMATLSGLTEVPDGLWPAMNDPRIDAAVSLVGVAFLFGPAGMQSLNVPLLTIGGTGDTVAPPDWNIYLTHENASSAKKALAVFAGSEHYFIADGCDRTPWVSELGLFFLCTDPVWDVNRAHDLINHFTTAFLLATLKGDKDAAAALAADQVQFPGIEYQTQGF